jgi:hypothetical protein
MRTRVVPYIRLLDQADMHWEFAHRKTREDAMSAQVVRYLYVVGVIAIILSSILAMTTGQTGVAIGIATLTVGNLLWRFGVASISWTVG